MACVNDPSPSSSAADRAAMFAAYDRRTTRFPKTPCPYCARATDATTYMLGASESEAKVPTDGAASICRGCRNVAIFVMNAFGISLRRPTADERNSIMVDKGYQKV